MTPETNPAPYAAIPYPVEISRHLWSHGQMGTMVFVSFRVGGIPEHGISLTVHAHYRDDGGESAPLPDPSLAIWYTRLGITTGPGRSVETALSMMVSLPKALHAAQRALPYLPPDLGSPQAMNNERATELLQKLAAER